MEELMTIDNTTLKNKKLVSNVNRINKSINGMKKNTWTVAESLHNIVSSECWKDDFNNLSELGEYIGFSVASISKMVRSYELYKTEDLQVFLTDYSVGQVSELLPIGNPSLVIGFINEYHVTCNVSCKEIRELVHDYKALLSSTKNETEDETEVDTEDETEVDTEDETEETVIFHIDIGTFEVPVEVLEKYRINN